MPPSTETQAITHMNIPIVDPNNPANKMSLSI